MEAGELSGLDAAGLVERLRGHLDSVGGLTVPAERQLVRRARRADRLAGALAAALAAHEGCRCAACREGWALLAQEVGPGRPDRP